MSDPNRRDDGGCMANMPTFDDGNSALGMSATWQYAIKMTNWSIIKILVLETLFKALGYLLRPHELGSKGRGTKEAAICGISFPISQPIVDECADQVEHKVARELKKDRSAQPPEEPFARWCGRNAPAQLTTLSRIQAIKIHLVGPLSPSSPTTMNLSTSASELDVPIGLAVDFADELEFELGLSSVQDKPVSMSVSSPRLSSVQMSPSPSQISTGGNMTSLAPNSPTSTAYMTSPPTSPTPMSFAPDTRPDSDSECEEEGTIDSNSAVGLEKGKAPMAPPRHDTKGKSRAIPTPKLPFRDLSLHEFQTPPDTTFGTPSGSGVGSTGTRSRSRANNTMLPADESTRDLPSIMPLGPSSSSNSSEPEIDVTPRPSRIRSRALSGLSFSSLRDAVNSHRKSMSRQPSITISGTSSPTPSLEKGSRWVQVQIWLELRGCVGSQYPGIAVFNAFKYGSPSKWRKCQSMRYRGMGRWSEREQRRRYR
ncbi:hypothetical protein AG1IA_07468 [Rhizoctonia solani AG-1 IA]|uniref:Uncharacterized protein n=1 Tax=Thanatephorus cucumeris (strain AG1-IA) TaxID=983506 RepID=L8WP11_THACA|nr:hypothetical protein AG1IA_07468 [Rhizoctonia solani AG-1 IA]